MANIFQRINDVITANISDLIDRVEDPEKMIKQIIREMEENIGRAKEGVVDAIAHQGRDLRISAFFHLSWMGSLGGHEFLQSVGTS